MARTTALVVVVLLLVAGCGTQPLLASVEVRPDVITPNGDGKDDVAELRYALSANANISITLSSADGHAYAVRTNQPRAAGEYQLLFGGVVGGAVLPNGTYTLRVEAVPVAGGAPMAQVRSVTLRDSDTRLP
ncbi:MAG: hypothetical protein E6J26_09800, partial [Chloroflexi bacterium]